MDRHAAKFFVRWAHLQAGPTDVASLPSDDEIRDQVRVVEDLIEGVTRLFFDARRAVDDLLDEINQTGEGESVSSFRAPTEAQVKEAMRRITKTQLRRAFFEGIENPLRVKPLADAGAFRNPPEPVMTEDGYVRDVYWPEAEFLSNVAPRAPQEVVDVFLALGGSNNSWVRRAAFEIGAKVPAEYGAQRQAARQVVAAERLRLANRSKRSRGICRCAAAWWRT